jgi:hypothetical protein
MERIDHEIYRQHISISVDGVWGGTGWLNDGVIEDCAAVLGGSQDESDRIYESIEEAIADGAKSLQDGDVCYSWTISD